MSSVLQSDIFFFISSVSVIFLTIAVLIALIYLIHILRDIRAFFKVLRDGAEALSEDVSRVRTMLTNKGIWTGLVLGVISAITGFSEKMRDPSSDKRSKRKKEE